MCSAPGGKALVLASMMFATHDDAAKVISRQLSRLASNVHRLTIDIFSAHYLQYGMLVCNELSPKRRIRLRKVLDEYLPAKVQECIRVTGHDGTKWHR